MQSAVKPPDDTLRLDGLKVLVVEDDYFVAIVCADVLRDHGAEVLGPVPDVAQARAIAFRENPDCVLLDVNLKGEMAFDLADSLIQRGVPTVFATGYDPSYLPAPLRRARHLMKPIETHELVRAVQQETRSRRRPD